MKRNKLTFLAFVLVLLSFNVSAQDKFKNQAMFLFNFTRMNAWPQEAQAGDFIIGIYGNSPILNEIQAIAESRQVGSRKIVVKQFNDVSEISSCQMIYVASNQSRNLEAISQKLKSDKISALLITENRNSLSSGAAVNFVLDDNRQRYEVSEANARSVGVTLGSDMVRLASNAR
jgi:hypothetical protein